MDSLQRSYVIDHNDPAIRHHAETAKEVERVLGAFRSKDTTVGNLRALGDALAPSTKIEQDAKVVADSVQEVVKKCGTVNIDRTCISGSFGKRTALPDFDIDLVLFLNDASPPFESEIECLRSYLSNNLKGVTILKSSPFSVTFLFNGFKVDLLPAPNLVKGPSECPRIDQHRELLKELSKVPPTKELEAIERARYYSPAFSESVVHFVKKQQPFVNAAVRLAKMWKYACAVTRSTFPRWFSSFLIELIVSNAAILEMRTNPHDASLIRVLRSFFQQLSSPASLKIVFTEYYPESAIPEWIASQRPLVMDPANPYGNVAKQMNWEIIRLLALDMLGTLDKATKQPSSVPIGELFRPRLGEDVHRLYRQCNFQLKFIKESSWLRRVQVRKIADLNGNMMDQGVIWRATDKLERNNVAKVAKPHILKMLETLVEVTNLALIFHVSKEVNERGVCEVVAASNFIDDMLYEVFDMNRIDWTPSSRTVESCDVTCIFGQIPIPSTPDDLRYLYFSLSFDVEDRALDYVSNCIAADIRREQEEED